MTGRKSLKQKTVDRLYCYRVCISVDHEPKRNRNGMRLVSISALLLLTGATVWANTITVNTAADAVANDRLCSLREAIENANDHGQTNVDCAAGSNGSDTIIFDAGLDGATITVTQPGDTGFSGSAYEILQGTTLSIDASSLAHGITITRSSATGTPNFRLLYVAYNGTAALSNVTLMGGQSDSGAGIDSLGTVFLSQCSVIGNTATIGGAGISNGYGSMTISNVIVSGNSLTGTDPSGMTKFYGAGIFNSGSFNASNLTITNNSLAVSGSSTGVGGGIANYGSMTLDRAVVENNQVSGYADAAGIYNAATAKISESTIINNRTTNSWYTSTTGGIYNGTIPGGATLTLSQSLVSGNNGVGIGNFEASATVVNTTISQNGADGISHNPGAYSPTFTVINSTIANNVGHGVNGPSSLSLSNTIVAGNVGGNCAHSPDISQGAVDNGGNLDDGSSCGFGASSYSNTDPMLGPLGYHGGQSQSLVPAWGSVAINHGIDSVCVAIPVSAVDQRGVPRAQGLQCDIGAVEWRITDDTIFANEFD